MTKNVLIAYIIVFQGFCNTCVQGSIKKGAGVGPKNFMCDDFKALNDMSWWYDWGANLNMIRKYSNCSNIERYIDNFIPMIWGGGSILNVSIPSSAAYILGFNEPNHFEQSNITAEQAAKYWPYMEELSKGRLLVSPAAAPCGGVKCHGNATEWFDKFFKYCRGCRVDYLATHYYSCDAEKTMAYLMDLYKRYGKKIWLTEFACPRTTSIEKELNYMKKILPRLEAAPFVFRYAWFVSRIKEGVFVTAAASLLEPESSTLTKLGQFFNYFTTMKSRHRRVPWLVSILNGIVRVWEYLLGL